MTADFLGLKRWKRKQQSAVQLSTRPRFEVDQSLVDRQIAETARLGENSILPVLPAQPKPIDFDREELPV